MGQTLFAGVITVFGSRAHAGASESLRLWFCCDRWPEASVAGGLTRHGDGTWTHFGARDGLPGDYVSDVFFDSAGAMYVLTRTGLAVRSGDRFRADA